MIRPFVALAASLLLAPAAPAQPSVLPGLDVACSNVTSLQALARTGTFPNGLNGLAMSTTCCNPGSVNVPFTAAMSAAHPFISFLLVRESAGRLVQISDASYCKHTFGSSNAPGACGPPCAGGSSANLVVGCFDTYGAGTNGDHYWLGPPSEINPWTGAWNPVCSHFDRGEPAVAPPNDCNGIRSLTTVQAAALNTGVNHRIRVLDGDLALPAASFYFQAQYVVIGEAEAKRDDPSFPLGANLGSKAFTPVWNGSSWTFGTGATLLAGSVLKRWSGATVTSGVNGLPSSPDDGRVYVGAKVTGPFPNGTYHYEYAFHNRDNSRGVSAIRIPLCAEASFGNAGFRDIDADAGNDWSAVRNPTEVVVSTATNPLLWNTIYNFWFESDAAPASGSSLTLDEFLAGPGASSFAVPASTPTGLYNLSLGPGCGVPSAPSLAATGTPGRATLGNATFGLLTTGHPAGVPVALFALAPSGATPLGGGCTVYSSSLAGAFPLALGVADGLGALAWATPVPNDPALEGLALDLQAVGVVPGGAFLGAFNLSNGLRVRVGDSVPGCP
ncbi:MAG TPA: hypothetical protein VFI25_12200 [Planctomycetota bacterium]|jgi:hypothetical protein|nr:hypothetical protein [Planctomycetota bacterium]